MASNVRALAQSAILGNPIDPAKQPNNSGVVDVFGVVAGYIDALVSGGPQIQGEWNAASGVFPGGGTADIGDAWIVTTAGTTGGVTFGVSDQIIAIKDNPGTGTYAANWVRLAANVTPVVQGVDSGAGTANAIAVATDYPVLAAGGQLVVFTVYEANTASGVTVQFNATGTAYAVKTASGNNPAVGALAAGIPVSGTISGATFRMISDQATAALLAAAEAAQAAAEAAQAAVAQTYTNILAALPAGMSIIYNGTPTAGATATLTEAVPQTHVFVFRNGVVQVEGDDFTISGTTLTAVGGNFSGSEPLVVFKAGSFAMPDVPGGLFATNAEMIAGLLTGKFGNPANTKAAIDAAGLTPAFNRGRPEMSERIFAVLAGASNTVGGSADDDGGDTTSDDDVEIYNPSNNTFGVATMGSGPLAGSVNNFGLHMGKEVVATLNKGFDYCLVAQGGQPIDRWLADDDTPTLWTRMTTEVPAALALKQRTYVDVISMQVGEANNEDPILDVVAKFETFLAQCKAQSWWKKGHTKLLLGTLVDRPPITGPGGGERVQNQAIQIVADRNAEIGVVNLLDLKASADDLHFTSSEHVIMGKRHAHGLMMPTPALAKLRRGHIVDDTVDITCGSGKNTRDPGELFEYFSEFVSIKPQGRLRGFIDAGDFEPPPNGSWAIGWHVGRRIEIYGTLADGFVAPVKADFGGTRAADLAAMRAKYLTRFEATGHALVCLGEGGLISGVLIQGNGTGSPYDGIRTRDPNLPAVPGGRLRVANSCIFGFDVSGGTGVKADTPGSYIELASNVVVAHSHNGLFANGAYILAGAATGTGPLLAYCGLSSDGVKNTATDQGTILALNQQQVGGTTGSERSFVASNRGLIRAIGADNASDKPSSPVGDGLVISS